MTRFFFAKRLASFLRGDRRARLLGVALLLLGLLGPLTGCSSLWKNKSNAQVAVTPKQEKWCYRSLGYVECFPTPQNLPPDQLVEVDPPSRYPATPEAYRKAVAAAP